MALGLCLIVGNKNTVTLNKLPKLPPQIYKTYLHYLLISPPVIELHFLCLFICSFMILPLALFQTSYVQASTAFWELIYQS